MLNLIRGYTVDMEEYKSKDRQHTSEEREERDLPACPDFRTYFEATVIKTVWYWCRDRNSNQQNRMYPH